MIRRIMKYLMRAATHKRKVHGVFSVRENLRVQIHDAKTGELLKEWTQGNDVMNKGLELIASLILNDNIAPTHVAVGTGTAAVAPTQLTLQTEVFRDRITGKAKDATNKATIQMFLRDVEANGNTLSEAGIFNNPSSGDMLSRVLLSPVIVKTAAVTATLTWIYTITEGP